VNCRSRACDAGVGSGYSTRHRNASTAECAGTSPRPGGCPDGRPRDQSGTAHAVRGARGACRGIGRDSAFRLAVRLHMLITWSRLSASPLLPVRLVRDEAARGIYTQRELDAPDMVKQPARPSGAQLECRRPPSFQRAQLPRLRLFRMVHDDLADRLTRVGLKALEMRHEAAARPSRLWSQTPSPAGIDGARDRGVRVASS
jgi:hypothetical protein